MVPHRLNLFEHHVLSKKHALELGLTILGLVLVLIGGLATYSLLTSFDGRFYPDSQIDSYAVGNLQKSEVEAKFRELPLPPTHQVTLKVQSIEVASSSAELGLKRDYQTAVDKAYEFDQRQPLAIKLGRILGLLSLPHIEKSYWQYEPQAVTRALEVVQSQITSPSVPAKAELGTSGKVATLKIEPGKAGTALDIPKAIELANAALTSENLETYTQINLDPALVVSDPELSADQLAAAQKRAEALVGNSLTLSGDDQKFTIYDRELISWLAFPEGYRSDLVAKKLGEWQTLVSRPPQDAELSYDKETLVVSNFKPPQNGLHLDEEKTSSNLKTALQTAETDTSDQTNWPVELALAITPPTKTLADTNDLGIKEVIGFGESEYDHSIPSRIHNVSLTSAKISNHIIKPGEEFSFNATLGDVSAETGFKPAYVIKDGQTVLGDGGGVCQVSTTLFRAVLNAGLKVTKRRPHSYRVTYYELNQKPGFDATVYSGDVDLRFINDTKDAILISSQADSKNLYMKVTLYGTSDGRTTEVKDYQSWNARPAPPPVYTVDPTLAPGQTKQVDWATSGIQTKFTNVIKAKDGSVIREDVYASNYVPWSAKYLVGP